MKPEPLSSIDRVEFLRGRSKAYYEYSQEAFERGGYDIAIFNGGASRSATHKICDLRILGYTPE
jgi:HEPN domain-containing protein